MDEVIIEALKAWGCDPEAGIRRLAGNRHSYVQFVRETAEELDEPTLRLALETGNASAAFDAAHYHKGSVSGLGLTPLLTPIETITEKTREGNCAEALPYLMEIALRQEELRQILALGEPV